MNKKKEICKLHFYFFSIFLAGFLAYTVNYWELIGNPELFNISFSLKLLTLFTTIFIPLGIFICFFYYEKLIVSKEKVKSFYWIFGLILIFLIFHFWIYSHYKIDLITNLIPFFEESLLKSFFMGLLFWFLLNIFIVFLISENFDIKKYLYLTLVSCLIYTLAYGIYFAVGIFLMFALWR